MFTVFIDGDQGTTGLRVRERLAGREDIMLLSLPEDKRKDLDARAAMARQADATILCLPDLHAPRPYAVGQSHKHLPEIMHVCGLMRPPVFQPVVMDVFSGMLVSLPLTEGILARKASLAEVSDTYRAFFKGAALVRVLEDNPEAVIDSVALSGSDRMELFVTGNDDRMIAYARFDNLGKGACGAAIECLNLVLGAPPLTGLAL